MLPPDDKPQEIDGRFRLQGDRVAGGMGMVHRGLDLATGETVAVKISSGFGSQLGERFQQEATCLAAMAHPAIVRYIAHGKTLHGEHYLVMEWLDGETLEDRLARGPISMGASAQMIQRVAEALAVAHQHGVVHRDIKPANIFLPGKDLSKIKLLDFGIARRLFEAANLRLTQAGSALGTPMYMSPEQAQGSLDVDGRADIFSLGCVFFECLTGSPPFMADSATGALAQVAEREELDVEGRCVGVPKRLVSMLRRMLAKSPNDRPSSMADILSELLRLTSELRGTGAYPVAPRPRRAPADAALLMATGERRLAAVIVVSPRGAPTPPPVFDPTATADLGNLLARSLSDAEFDDARLEILSKEMVPFGALIRRLPNRTMVVTLTADAQSTPLDLAARAARAALKLKQARPGSSLGISLGHAIKDDELRTEHLVNSAVGLVSKQHLGSIHVNEEIKRLLEGRFEIVVEADGRARLLFEKGLREAPRTVLGKEIPCLGRDREIRELEGLFEACVEEPQAQVVVLSGGAGCGKSRVAYEFLERMRDGGHGFELLIGRGDPMRANVSLGIIGQALRAAAGIAGTETDEVQRKRMLAHASRYLPGKNAANTAAFLGEIANVRFFDHDLPQLQAARRDARLMADQTLGAWMDFLEVESEHHPVLLLLEDLHWSDFASINYVDQALRVLGKKRFMVLALARPEIDERFHGLWRDRHVQRISLAPLGKRAGQEIIRRVLGDVPPEKIDWLLEHAQGNPFYLEELVRSAASGGDTTGVPDSILGTVQTRFDAAGEGSKQVLRAASIFGQSFYAAGVKALLGEISDEDVDSWLRILVDSEILFTRPVGNRRQHVFRHALFHQAAYSMLSPKDEVSGHYLAGDFLEHNGEQDAMVLADHFEKGQKPERAIRWLRVAANQAMEVDDLKAALDRVERGVRLGAQGDDLAELRCVESEARFWKGEYVQAERLAREALACEDSKLALRSANALIGTLGPQAKYEEIKSLDASLPEPPCSRELLNPWLMCKMDAAAFLAAIGQFEPRKRILALADSVLDQLDPVLVARAESQKAHLARDNDNLGEYVDRLRRAWSLFEQAGHKRAGFETLANVGMALMEVGQLEDAETEVRKLKELSERMGLQHVTGGILYMLSNILAYRGQLEAARAVGNEALNWMVQNKENYFRSYTLLYLAVVELLAKEYTSAERAARRALESVTEDDSLWPFALSLLAWAKLGQGRAVEAKADAESAYSRLQALGRVSDGDAYVRWVYAECLLALSEPAEARRIIVESVTRLKLKSDSIAKVDWRRSYWKRIPEHRGTADLALRLGIEGVSADDCL